ncbi:MAG: hypothetical protein ACP5IE_03495, partial [Infirmifilum sp.]
TYGSFAVSPRLLTIKELTPLVAKVSKTVNRRVEFVVVDPRIGDMESFIIGNVSVKYVRWLPKHVFLREVASADLYIEQNLDEELRYATLEAALVGTPIAKITLPKYLNRQDYTDDEVLIGTSFKQFLNKISEYIMNIDYYREKLSRETRRFVVTRRVWDAVKKPLINVVLRG